MTIYRFLPCLLLVTITASTMYQDAATKNTPKSFNCPLTNCSLQFINSFACFKHLVFDHQGIIFQCTQCKTYRTPNMIDLLDHRKKCVTQPIAQQFNPVALPSRQLHIPPHIYLHDLLCARANLHQQSHYLLASASRPAFLQPPHAQQPKQPTASSYQQGQATAITQAFPVQPSAVLEQMHTLEHLYKDQSRELPFDKETLITIDQYPGSYISPQDNPQHAAPFDQQTQHRFICPYCETPASSSTYKRHQKKCTAKPKKFRTVKHDYKKGMQVQESSAQSMTYHCPVHECRQYYFSVSDFDQHLSTTHPHILLKCAYCDQFTSKSLKGLLTHHGRSTSCRKKKYAQYFLKGS